MTDIYLTISVMAVILSSSVSYFLNHLNDLM